MEKTTYTFRNKGLGEFNDDVYELETFSILNNEFHIKIQPSQQTKFWRFGIVLSQTEQFVFNPNQGRYDDPGLKFIEIDIGDKLENGEWHLPNRIGIGCRHIEGHDIHPKIKDTYKEYSPVEITLKFDPSQNIYFSYSSPDAMDSKSFPVKGYNYFRMFAWSDKTEFAITCTVDVNSLSNAETDNVLMSQAIKSRKFNPQKPSKQPVFEKLTLRSHGEKVKEIQTFLKYLNLFNSAIDGIYGPSTASAVTDFQKRINLTATGEMDAATYNEILNAAKDIKNATSPEIEIAKKYLSDINTFIEKNNEWWNNAVPKWLSGEYAIKIKDSLTSAGIISETPVDKIKSGEFRKSMDVFFFNLSEVIRVAKQIEENNRTLALYSSANENNDQIRSFAQAAINKFEAPAPENFWLLKLNDNNWEIELLHTGDEIYFHSHTLDGEKREGYKLFQEIKIGDKVTGYAYGKTNGIVCNFVVIRDLQMNPSYGEIINLRVTELVKPPLSLSSFHDKISFASELEPGSLKKLISLTPEIYSLIIGQENIPGPPLQPIIFLPFLETEGSNIETKDQLDFENDIESLASVIAMKDVKPPLAIGLFGKWGSGKSFFMKQLKKKIIELRGYDSKMYVQNVVHVEFNSWHYSDTNLWASMVTKIFDTLEQYSKGINEDEDETERMKRAAEKIKVLKGQKSLIENEKNKLAKTILEKEEVQKKQREELADLTGFKILKLILTNKHVKEDYSELNNSEIETVVNDQKKINLYVGELEKSKNDLFAIARIIGSFRGRRWLFALGTILFVLLAKWLTATVFKDQYENITKFLSLGSTAALALVANLIKYTATARKSITEALGRMVSLRKTFDDRPSNDDKVMELKQKKEEIESDLQQIEIQLANTKKEIEDVESGRKLLDFVEQRSKDTNYANQLGLISWIRKDFENLTRLLSGQDAALKVARNKNPDEPQLEVVLRVDRIILYIDDLDRCNEDLVVKVLEAIHLILAFELFVVVVGVDPRWLNNALNEKYKNLFGVPVTNHRQSSKEEEKIEKGAGKTKAETEGKIPSSILEAATSYDYLEKIFQIPFCLKPINKKGREKLIGYLLNRGSKQEEELVQSPHIIPTAEDIPSDSVAGVGKEPAAIAKQVEAELEPTITETRISGAETTTGIEINKREPEKKFNPPVRVNFTTEETDFMKKMSVLFGQSPRSINRYVNIYRIIKSHKSFTLSGEYSFDEFGPTLFLLGIVVGHSVYASDFIDIVTAAKDTTIFRSFIKNPKINKELIKEITKCRNDDLWDMPMINYKRNVNLISRFSFRTLIDDE